MNRTKYILSGTMLLSLVFTKTAHASVDTGALFSISGIAEMVLLLCVVICLFWSMKIMSLVRGGMMSKSWQMFTLGFTFLMLARFLAIGQSVNLFVVPDYVSTILYLLMIATWLIGIYQTKRTLA
ncbi:MAG: hypothetical protein DRP51_00085 [Candidatus Zixiibacteriota bacterium]|nr:MAG: hypothetical protein DRP51_00085 [candidate division Zixibacteria bacterium]HHI02478.1 hypothetical protein [candidate division Zixibacteria bacterium]